MRGRLRGNALAVALMGICATIGCKGSDGQAAEASEEALAASARLTADEQELLERRDSLMALKQQVRSELADVNEERDRARKSGSDTSALDARAEKLRRDELRLLEDEEKIYGKLRDSLHQKQKIVEDLTAGSSAGARMAAREGSVAGREDRVARREADLAAREKELATREAKLAKREAETCGVGAPPTTIIKTVDAKGSSYTKRDVEPLLKQARRRMAQRGIRSSDLPPQVQDLEKEATEAMAGGDYGRASLAANQLLRSVNDIKVSKAFIQGKFSRLNEEMKGRKLSDKARSAVDKLFKEATESYGDGKFTQANKQLNRIYALL